MNSIIKISSILLLLILSACSSSVSYECTYQDMGENDTLTLRELNGYLIGMYLHTEVDIYGFDIDIEELKDELITAEKEYAAKDIEAVLKLDESNMVILSDFTFDYTNSVKMEGIIDIGIDPNDKKTRLMDNVRANLEDLGIFCK